MLMTDVALNPPIIDEVGNDAKWPKRVLIIDISLTGTSQMFISLSRNQGRESVLFGNNKFLVLMADVALDIHLTKQKPGVEKRSVLTRQVFGVDD